MVDGPAIILRERYRAAKGLSKSERSKIIDEGVKNTTSYQRHLDDSHLMNSVVLNFVKKVNSSYEVIIAKSGEEAVEKFASEKPDLVFMARMAYRPSSFLQAL